MDTSIRAYQHMSSGHERQEAEMLLADLLEQDGCIGGRVLQPRYDAGFDGSWRVQMFFELPGSPIAADCLPADVRLVIIPVSQFKALGIKTHTCWLCGTERLQTEMTAAGCVPCLESGKHNDKIIVYSLA